MVQHHGHDLMATDDEVAPRLPRKRAGQILALGLALMLVALAGMLVGLQKKAEFSIQDRQEIRQLIQDRKVQRDRQQALVEKQLLGQTRVLCAVVYGFRQDARRPEARASLDRAAVQLDCARVLGPAR